MTGGSLTSKNGHMFHVTNTNADIELNGVKLTNEDTANVLISVCDDGWNGGNNQATFNAKAQDLIGAVQELLTAKTSSSSENDSYYALTIGIVCTPLS